MVERTTGLSETVFVNVALSSPMVKVNVNGIDTSVVVSKNVFVIMSKYRLYSSGIVIVISPNSK